MKSVTLDFYAVQWCRRRVNKVQMALELLATVIVAEINEIYKIYKLFKTAGKGWAKPLS